MKFYLSSLCRHINHFKWKQSFLCHLEPTSLNTEAVLLLSVTIFSFSIACLGLHSIHMLPRSRKADFLITFDLSKGSDKGAFCNLGLEPTEDVDPRGGSPAAPCSCHPATIPRPLPRLGQQAQRVVALYFAFDTQPYLL